MPLLPLCSQIDVGATVNALLGDTFSRENNTHGSRFHDRDPQFASWILGAMTQSCYIGTRDIRSRVIRSPYCNGLEPNLCPPPSKPTGWSADPVFYLATYPCFGRVIFFTIILKLCVYNYLVVELDSEPPSRSLHSPYQCQFTVAIVSKPCLDNHLLHVLWSQLMIE